MRLGATPHTAWEEGDGAEISDDDASTFETDIDKLGTAGVTKGCNPGRRSLLSHRFGHPGANGSLSSSSVRALMSPLRYGLAITAIVALSAACSGDTAATTTTTPAASTTSSVAATSTTSMATTTTVGAQSVARLDGTWYVTYPVVENEVQGVDFDDFGGMSGVGDIDAARVWILEHHCDEGVCDADLDSRRPEAPDEEFLKAVLILGEDGAYALESQGEVGFGSCVVDDGEVFDDAFEEVSSIQLEVTEVEPAGEGWAATAMSGTRIYEASPVDEAEEGGCQIRWRTTTEVEAIRTDPDDPVPGFLPAGSEPITGRIAYLHSGSDATPGIWSVDPDQADAEPLLEVEGVNGFDWSPDATRLVYSTEQGDLWVSAADGSNPMAIGRGSLPAWSPDGTQLAFVRPRLDGTGEEVWVMSTLTGATERATTWGMSEVEATWVDSDRLIVNGIDPGETDPAMWVLNVETDESEPLVFGDSPEVSPDGSTVAYVWEGMIWTVDLDAAGDRQITEGPNDRAPTWSPDGSQIAFIRDFGSQFIWVVGSDGSTPEPVAVAADPLAWGPRE